MISRKVILRRPWKENGDLHDAGACGTIPRASESVMAQRLARRSWRKASLRHAPAASASGFQPAQPSQASNSPSVANTPDLSYDMGADNIQSDVSQSPDAANSSAASWMPSMGSDTPEQDFEQPKSDNDGLEGEFSSSEGVSEPDDGVSAGKHRYPCRANIAEWLHRSFAPAV